MQGGAPRASPSSRPSCPAVPRWVATLPLGPSRASPLLGYRAQRFPAGSPRTPLFLTSTNPKPHNSHGKRPSRQCLP